MIEKDVNCFAIQSPQWSFQTRKDGFRGRIVFSRILRTYPVSEFCGQHSFIPPASYSRSDSLLLYCSAVSIAFTPRSPSSRIIRIAGQFQSRQWGLASVWVLTSSPYSFLARTALICWVNLKSTGTTHQCSFWFYLKVTLNATSSANGSWTLNVLFSKWKSSGLPANVTDLGSTSEYATNVPPSIRLILQCFPCDW